MLMRRTIMTWYQQGDVTIKPASIPQDAQHVDSNVLADGEATGHTHRVVGDAELLRLGGRLFMRVLGGDVRVIHEEHKEIPLPPGEYEIGRVRAYDHVANVPYEVWD
jgi:hypothetical protein